SVEWTFDHWSEDCSGAGQCTLTINGDKRITANYIPAIAPPTIVKSFSPTTIPPNRTTTLSFEINNPNPKTTLTSVGFTDIFPVGMIVSTPNNLVVHCSGGIVTATPGSGSLNLIGGSIAPGGVCQFSVTVGVTQGTTPGTKNNVTSKVTSTEG